MNFSTDFIALMADATNPKLYVKISSFTRG